jgi:hypothetical protein
VDPLRTAERRRLQRLERREVPLVPALMLAATVLALPTTTHAFTTVCSTSPSGQNSFTWPNATDCLASTFSGLNCGGSQPDSLINGDRLASSSSNESSVVYIRFNGDTGAHYHYLIDARIGDPSNPASVRADMQPVMNETRGIVGYIPGANNPGNPSSDSTGIYIRLGGLGLATAYQSWLSDNPFTTSTAVNYYKFAGNWANPNTSNPITSITFFLTGTDTFSANSVWNLHCY